MILFWVICAVMVAIAFAFVLPPLFSAGGDESPDNREANISVYRDQLAELEADLKNGIVAEGQYQQDRDAIERRMLEDVSASEPATKHNLNTNRRPSYAVAVAIPVMALALYFQIGNPWSKPSGRPAVPTTEDASQAVAPNAGMTQQSIEANVDALAKRLANNPSDLQGWTMLGRSYVSLERYKEAADAYQKATSLKTDDAELWADYAFATAMANGQRLQGQPEEFIKKALQIDPENPKALELAGSAAFEAKNYSQAVDYWQRLLAKTPANSDLAQVLNQRISQAKSLAAEAKR